MIYTRFGTPDPSELHTSVRGQNGVEFHWESNEHGVRHMAHVHYVSDVCFLFGVVQCSIFLIISNSATNSTTDM